MTATVRMGILADKPGAGKSYTVMEVLLTPDLPAATEVHHQVTAHMSYRTSAESVTSPAPVSVLVFPHNLAKQWEGILETRVPPNRLVVLSRLSALGKAKDCIDSAAGIPGAPVMGPPTEIQGGAAAGTTPGTIVPMVIATTATNFPLVLDHLSSRRVTVLRIVFDEADSIRLTKCSGHYTAARFHWFVTASPHNLFGVPYDHTAGRVEYRHATGATFHALSHGFPNVHSAYVRDFFSYASADTAVVQNCLCAVTVMSDDAFVEASFNVPLPESTDVVCRSDQGSLLLNGIVNRSVIDRLNAGDVRGALATLNPACVSSETNVVSVAAAGLQNALTNLKAQLLYTDSRVYSDASARDAARARIDGRIRSTTLQIENLEKRIREADVCPICYEDLVDNKTVVPCCSNSFCLRCITKWLVADGSIPAISARSRPNGTCPMCKAPLAAGMLMVVARAFDGETAGCEGSSERSEPSTEDEASPESSRTGVDASASSTSYQTGFNGDPAADKITNLASLMRFFSDETMASGSPRRILVFSDNDEIMGRVSREVMAREGIRHSFLKSNAAVINARARDFRQTAGVYALLTNIKYYGSGLDLSAATDIVLMHKVPEGMAAQVVGRAQRPPRESPLRIWKFRNDIEDVY